MSSDERKHLLIVDDNSDNAEMFALALRQAGFQCSVALSARDALAAAEREQFDLVLSDIGMPEMNGYELAASLRRMPAYLRTPLIAFTGFSFYDDRERSLRAGFNLHLSKPIDLNTLVKKVERLINR